MVKQFFKYIFKTSLDDKICDWTQYKLLCKDLRHAKKDKDKAREKIISLKSSETGCFTYDLMFSVEDMEYIGYERECKNILDETGKQCMASCPYFIDKRKYLAACQLYDYISFMKSGFWKDKIYEMNAER